MSGFNRKFKVWLLLMAVSSIHCHKISRRDNPGAEIEGGRKDRRHPSKRASSTFPFGSEQRKERFCLRRLTDALEIVCSSGSGSIPLYFSPTSYRLSTSANDSAVHQGMRRKSRQLKNDISPMAPQKKRHVIHHRARRNVVDECCKKPCTYQYLTKYCSTSLSFRTDGKVTSTPVVNQEGKNGKLSRSIHSNQPAIAAAGLSSRYYLDYAEPSDNYIDDSDQRMDTSPPYPIQCVPVPDLKSYYRKLSQAQSKKDGQPPKTLSSGLAPTVQTTKQNDSSNASPSDNPKNHSTQTNKLKTTNPLISSSSNVPKQDFEFVTELNSQLSQELATEGSTTRQDNELGELSQVEQTTTNWILPSNTVTAKPITRLISLPVGSNDYIY